MNEMTASNPFAYFDNPDRLSRLAGAVNMLSSAVRESCLESSLEGHIGANHDAQKALLWMESHYKTVSSVIWSIETISDELNVILMDYPSHTKERNL